MGNIVYQTRVGGIREVFGDAHKDVLNEVDTAKRHLPYQVFRMVAAVHARWSFEIRSEGNLSSVPFLENLYRLKMMNFW